MSEIGMASDQPAQFQGGRPQALAARMLDELDQDDADSAREVENSFWELLAEIQSATASRPSRPRPAWLDAVRESLNASLQKPPSLNAVAREFGVHPMHLAATFRRHYGCSVGEHVRRQRVDAAREMLENPDLSLTQIASDVGFADQSHLTRTFKRLTGVTPGQYRTFLPFKTR
jgi:AraC family transcriptional regulator